MRRSLFSLAVLIVPLFLFDCTPEERDYSTGGGNSCQSQMDCQSCCYTDFFEQSVALDRHVHDACACNPQATCYTDCFDPGTAKCQPFDAALMPCQACLSGTVTNTDPCYQVAIGSCKGDPNCMPFYSCITSCTN